MYSATPAETPVASIACKIRSGANEFVRLFVVAVPVEAETTALSSSALEYRSKSVSSEKAPERTLVDS